MTDRTRAADRPRRNRRSSAADGARDVLAARARLLAQPLDAGEGERSGNQLLGFEAGGRRFALPAASVITVVSGVRPTLVPHLPAWVAGAINVRGRVVAAVCPDQFVGAPANLDETVGRSMAVVVAGASAEVALLVDQLDPVDSIGSNAIERLPVGASDLLARVARGTIDGRVAIDPDALIAAIRSSLQPTADAPAATPYVGPSGQLQEIR